MPAIGDANPESNTIEVEEKGYQDANGNTIYTLDNTGTPTEYFYDALNRQTKVKKTNIANVTGETLSVTAYWANSNQRSTQSTDSQDSFTLYNYDKSGSLTSTERSVRTSTGLVWQTQVHTYDPFGNRTSTEDSNLGSTVSENRVDFQYDDTGRLILTSWDSPTRLADQLNKYDAFGNLTYQADVKFDEYGQLETESNRLTWGHNNLGQVKFSTNGSVTSNFFYTSLGELRKAQSSDSDGVISEYIYERSYFEKNRHVGKVTQNQRVETSDLSELKTTEHVYWRDLSGREIKATTNYYSFPAGLSIDQTQDFDLVGRLTSKSLKSNSFDVFGSVDYQYNSQGILDQVKRSTIDHPNSPDTSKVEIFTTNYTTYQDGSGHLQSHRMAGAANDFASRSQEYDPQGRLSKTTLTTLEAAPEVLTFGDSFYDAPANGTTLVTDFGRSLLNDQVKYDYDEYGRVSTGDYSFNPEILTGTPIASQDGPGFQSTELRTLGRGKYRIRFYDFQFEIDGEVPTSGQIRATIKNASDAILFETQIAEVSTNGVYQDFTFSLDKLDTESTLFEFQYKSDVDGSSWEYAELQSVNASFEISSVLERTFTWDRTDRLTRVIDLFFKPEDVGTPLDTVRHSSTVDFTYDVFGNLIGKAVEHSTTPFNENGVEGETVTEEKFESYIYKDNQRIIYLNSDGVATDFVIHSLDGEAMLASKPNAGDDGELFWTVADYDGTIRFVVGGDLEGPDRQKFNFLGRNLDDTSRFTNLSFFQGYQFEAETGLFLQNGRIFDAKGQQYLAESLSGGSNYYQRAAYAPSGSYRPFEGVARQIGTPTFWAEASRPILAFAQGVGGALQFGAGATLTFGTGGLGAIFCGGFLMYRGIDDIWAATQTLTGNPDDGMVRTWTYKVAEWATGSELAANVADIGTGLLGPAGATAAFAKTGKLANAVASSSQLGRSAIRATSNFSGYVAQNARAFGSGFNEGFTAFGRSTAFSDPTGGYLLYAGATFKGAMTGSKRLRFQMAQASAKSSIPRSAGITRTSGTTASYTAWKQRNGIAGRPTSEQFRSWRRGNTGQNGTGAFESSTSTSNGLYSRPAWRKTTLARAESASRLANDGELLCATCGIGVSQPISVQTRLGQIVRRGYDLDHFPDTLAERIRRFKNQPIPPTRPEFIEEFQLRVRVQCPTCNQSHRWEGIRGNFQ